MPLQKPLGDEAGGIAATDGLIKPLAIKRGVGACAPLEMMDKTGGRVARLAAEGAAKGTAAMDLGAQMLRKSQFMTLWLRG